MQKNTLYEVQKKIKGLKDEQKGAEKTILEYNGKLKQLEASSYKNSKATDFFKNKIAEAKSKVAGVNSELAKQKSL